MIFGFKRFHPQYYVHSKLGESRGHEFCMWALGENYGSTSLRDVPTIWNELHGDIFLISGAGSCQEDIDKMIEAWEISSRKLNDSL